jgi:hypothetical protein
MPLPRLTVRTSFQSTGAILKTLAHLSHAPLLFGLQITPSSTSSFRQSKSATPCLSLVSSQTPCLRTTMTMTGLTLSKLPRKLLASPTWLLLLASRRKSSLTSTSELFAFPSSIVSFDRATGSSCFSIVPSLAIKPTTNLSSPTSVAKGLVSLIEFDIEVSASPPFDGIRLKR